MRLTGRDDEHIGLIEPHDRMDGLHKLRRPTPIAFRVQIAQHEKILFAFLYTRNGLCYFLCNEVFSTSRAFVVKKDSGRRKETVSMPVLLCEMIRSEL